MVKFIEGITSSLNQCVNKINESKSYKAELIHHFTQNGIVEYLNKYGDEIETILFLRRK